MPVANHPSAAIRKHEFRGRGQKCLLELRLDRLGDQPTRAGSQNFGERIVDCPFLSKGNNSILGHGVTLLLGGSGGLITNPVTPPSSHRHPVSRITHKQVSLTDPDARSMATSGKGTGIVGYNVQIAVDAEHHLIVAHDVTNVGSDRAQLTAMSRKARAASGCEEVTVLADRGH